MAQKGVIHAVFDCAECGKRWTDYTTARKLAAAHARATGHEVRGEVAYSVIYGEKKK